MATSSILTELVIEDPKKAEAFINALECPVKNQYVARLPRPFPY